MTGAIRLNQDEASCAHLIDWMRVAIMVRPDPNAHNAYLAPANCLAVGALRQVDIDDALQAYRWSLLTQDLPALDPLRLAPSDQMVALVGALRQDRMADRNEDQARRVADAAPKLPSEAFPMTVPRWMLFAGVHSERDLPDIYGRFAACNKSERRVALADALEQRAHDASAATAIAPVATKELYEMILQGKLAPPSHEMDDLTLGIHPFSCGYSFGQQGTTVQARAQRYDLMMAGLTAPTLAEQDTFSTKEVPIPKSPYTGGLMIKSCSVVLDVVQGPGAPLASSYRSFCARQWPEIEALLILGAESDPEMATNVVPSILRWIQVHMVHYLRRLMMGHNPRVPDFDELTNIVLRKSFNLLPNMPSRYRVQPGAASLAGSPAGIPAARAPAPAPAPGGPPATAAPRGGAIITNPNVTTGWPQALEASGRRLAELRETAPKTTNRAGQTVPLCLSWHLKGSCYENCSRNGTHRNLAPQEAQAMRQFVTTLAPPAQAPAVP
jgi:hypothetical protein